MNQMTLLQTIVRIWKKPPPNQIRFRDLKRRKDFVLYSGDVPEREEYARCIGLSLTKRNINHIQHDVCQKLPLKANSIDCYQSEDVFEHLEMSKVPEVINEIYRVLKVGGLFRLSLPDYRCDLLMERSVRDDEGNIIFDPTGGGDWVDGKVINGGHLWFPRYETVKEILQKTKFTQFQFLHYYDENGQPFTHTIDYSQGFIMRTPDHDSRVSKPYRPLSVVVDCYK